MWITRDNSNGFDYCIFVWDEKPPKIKGVYTAEYSNDATLIAYMADFQRLFPDTKLPRKGSCREIAGLKIIEKGE